ncbi:MAG: hypothetical protein GY754_03120 [bacterium]|nr:hypothetical protein [bacterium]
MKTETKIKTDNEGSWKFPDQVTLMHVTDYNRILENREINNTVLFDLSETCDIHASFVGFLINAKSIINKSGNRLFIFISAAVEKLLSMLNILDYFSYEIVAP